MFVTMEEAQASLPELIEKLIPGLELVITKDGYPVAKVTKEPPRSTEPRVPGSAKGQLTIISDDDEHLADFKEYM